MLNKALSGPIFFDWQKPWLSHLAEMLMTEWSIDGKKKFSDLADTVVILPSKRAGRKLLELLAVQAAKEKKRFIPPRIMTLREAIPFLLPLEKKSRNQAGAFAQRLAWREAAQELTQTELSTLGTPPTFFINKSNKQSQHVIVLAEELAERLGSYGLGFADIHARIGKLSPESADREEARWKTLAKLQKKYRTHLHSWGLIDPNDALLEHLAEGKLNKTVRLFVAGVIDAPSFLESFFEKVNPTIVVIAPKDHASGFDHYGKLIPAYWLSRPSVLTEKQLIVCDRSEDQAREVINLLQSCKTPPSHFVTLVAERESLPLLRDRLEEVSFPIRWGGGIPFFHGRLYQLLRVTADFVNCEEDERPSSQALGALLRHPDIQRHVPQADIILKKLDRYEQEHLCSELDKKSFPWLVEIKKVVNFSSEKKTLAQCAIALRDFLFRLLGDEIISNSTPEGHYFLGCLKKLLEQLDTLEELSWQSKSLWSLFEVISLLLEVMASEAIPERENAETIECVGWLELAADEAPCAIVTSCQEGFLPRSYSKHPLLPESLCNALGLDNNTTLLARDLYLLHLINASRNLTIIAPRYNAQGDLVRPSRLLLWGCQALPERMLRLLQAPKENTAAIIHQESHLGPRLVGREPIERITVTSLRTYLQSPRLFYLQHVLKLQEILPAPQEMTASHFGMLIHSVLAAFAREPFIAESTDIELLSVWLRKKLLEQAKMTFSQKLSPLLRLQLEEVAKSLEGFATAQVAHRRAGWKIIAAEMLVEKTITLSDGRHLCLQGRIDRIDWHPEQKRWLLIDYKTSHHIGWERDTPDTTHYQKKGEQVVWYDLQLPLYFKLMLQLKSLTASELPVPSLENTDLCYFQLPVEPQKTRLSSPFNATMIQPAWEEADRILKHILDYDFEEIGTIDAKQMPTLAALCGIAGLWKKGSV